MIVLYGGEHFYDNPKKSGKDNTKLNDIWLFDIDKGLRMEENGDG